MVLKKGNSYKPEDLIMIQVSGSSMYPTFSHGDLLLFKKQDTKPRNNEVIAILDGNSIIIKRFMWLMGEDGNPKGLLSVDNPEVNIHIKEVDNIMDIYLAKFISIIKKN